VNLQDLISLTGSLVDEAFTVSGGKIPQELTSFFNACSGDLTDIARYTRRAVLDYDPAVVPNEVTLPNDLHKLAYRDAVWFNGSPLEECAFNDAGSRGYRLWGKTLLLQSILESGMIEVYYYSRLPRFEGLAVEEPVIPAQFHDLYALYAAAKWRQGQPGNLTEKRDLWSEYNQRKTVFELYAMINDPAPYPLTRESD